MLHATENRCRIGRTDHFDTGFLLLSETSGYAGGGASKKALALSIERSELQTKALSNEHNETIEENVPVYGRQGI